MLVLLVVFAGAVVYKWNAGHSRIAVGTVDDGNPEHALDKKTLAKALARNLLASNLAEQGAERRVTAQAPLQAADTQSLELLDPQKAPEPPESYSFTPYLGEMDEARFETRLNPPKRQVDSEGDAWLNDPEAAVTLVQQAREAEREWTFGYLRLVTHASADDIDTTLASLGVEIVGVSGDLIRAKLPGSSNNLKAILALPQIRGLASVPPERKVAASFVSEAAERSAADEAPVFITLMTGDPDGHWRAELQAMGVTVGRFHADIRVYEANLPYGSLQQVTKADFVLAVEPVGIVRPVHDTLVPAMGADALRRYSSSRNLFSGVDGADIPVGVMDTGLNTDHLDISFNRRSICGANFVTDGYWWEVDEQHDLWFDRNGHGTHVTGTILGAGRTKPELAGIAPNVKDIRFAKVLSAESGGTLYSVLDGMDFLAQSTRCTWSGGNDHAGQTTDSEHELGHREPDLRGTHGK